MCLPQIVKKNFLSRNVFPNIEKEVKTIVKQIGSIGSSIR